MKIVWTLLLPALAMWVGSGCHSMRGYPPRLVSESVELQHLRPYFTDDVLKTFNELKDPKERKNYRDMVVYGRMRAIDLQFEIFAKAINRERNATQLATDWAVLGLSGAGAVGGGGATTKAILHAMSGGITGARLSIDKTLFYEKTMPTLLAQMEAMRSEQRAIIRAGLIQSADLYPLGAALQDVDLYMKVGTLPGAILAINKAAGTKAEQADQEMKNVVQVSFKRAKLSQNLLQFYMDPSGRPIPLKQQELRAAMTKAGVPDTVELSDFIYDEKYAEARDRVAAALGLK